MYSSMVNPTYKSAKRQWEERKKDLLARLNRTTDVIETGNQLVRPKTDFELLNQK